MSTRRVNGKEHVPTEQLEAYDVYYKLVTPKGTTYHALRCHGAYPPKVLSRLTAEHLEQGAVLEVVPESEFRAAERSKTRRIRR